MPFVVGNASVDSGSVTHDEEGSWPGSSGVPEDRLTSFHCVGDVAKGSLVTAIQDL